MWLSSYNSAVHNAEVLRSPDGELKNITSVRAELLMCFRTQNEILCFKTKLHLNRKTLKTTPGLEQTDLGSVSNIYDHH